MKLGVIRCGLALLFSAAGVGLSHADCARLHALAQQHAYDMARRNSLEHAGFMRHRGPAGAAAENVAVGCDTEACARRLRKRQPGTHRASCSRGAAATASTSVRRYWVMEIGGRGGRGGRGGEIAGRDFSIEGRNAP